MAQCTPGLSTRRSLPDGPSSRSMRIFAAHGVAGRRRRHHHRRISPGSSQAQNGLRLHSVNQKRQVRRQTKYDEVEHSGDDEEQHNTAAQTLDAGRRSPGAIFIGSSHPICLTFSQFSLAQSTSSRLRASPAAPPAEAPARTPQPPPEELSCRSCQTYLASLASWSWCASSPKDHLPT